MLTRYATIEDFQSYCYQFSAGTEGFVEKILPNASRTIDRYIGVEDYHFGQIEEADTATARTYYGNGTNYLEVDPHGASPAPTLAMPTGYTVPGYVAHRKQFFFAFEKIYGDNALGFGAVENGSGFDGVLFAQDIDSRNSSLGWLRGVPITVTAKWGWDETPGDIKEACLEVALQIYRGRDSAYARVVNLEAATVVNDALTPRALMICNQYKASRAVFA